MMAYHVQHVTCVYRIMHDCMVQPPYCQPDDIVYNGVKRMGDCGSDWGALIYFGLYFIVSTYILLSLFVAVIVDNFAACSLNEVLIPEEAIVSFKVAWARHTYRSDPPFKYLAGHELYSFLDDVEEPLGFGMSTAILLPTASLMQQPSDTSFMAYEEMSTEGLHHRNLTHTSQHKAGADVGSMNGPANK